MKARTEQHLEKATAYIAVAESGDAKRAAYEQAADEILAALAEDETLTHRAVGERIGKSYRWVGTLLAWRREGHAHALPFARGEAQERYAQRQVPTRHEDRVEMATKLLEDPTVAKAAVKTVMANPSHARRAIGVVMHDHNAEKRRQERERAAQRRADEAMPLPAYMAKMVEKMNEWSLGLAGLYDDLDELPEGRGRELVAAAAAQLAEQAQRWVDRLNGRPALTVIEGRAKAIASP
jgi:hypothetical protein